MLLLPLIVAGGKMSHKNHSQLVLDEVSAVLRNGGVVDVCRLSRRLQPLCTDSSLQDIEAQVAAAVAAMGGCAIWERQSGDQA